MTPDEAELGSMRMAHPLVRMLVGMRWHAIRLYRLADRLHSAGHHNLAVLIFAFNRQLTGVEIHPGAKFGPGLVIGHTPGIVVNARVRVGADCYLFHGVTIGVRGESLTDVPVIGDRVKIYPGAKVLGPISIGDDVVIGANALVVQDVPAGSVVKTTPSQINENRSRHG
jgi:serine O-acetyltransferase